MGERRARVGGLGSMLMGEKARGLEGAVGEWRPDVNKSAENNSLDFNIYKRDTVLAKMITK